MKLIEDQQAYAFQRRVGLKAASEDTFGYHFDAGVRPDLAVQANAITDGLAHLLAQFAGQPFGGRSRRQTPGFKHENGLPGQPRLVQQRQRHAGGLAGAWWCFKHRFVTFFQGLAQGGQDGIDR